MLGTDNLLFVPATALASNTKQGSIVQLSGNTTDYLDGTNTFRPVPVVPVADTTHNGLLRQVSGNATDYVGGDNACHSIAAINAFVTKTSAYTLTPADSGKYVICSGGSWTLTLPAPVVGLNYRLRNDMGISGSVGTITLQPTGGTIDGAASLALLPQQECTVITDGTNWRTFGLKREVILGTQDITSSTASGSVLLPVGYRYFELQFTGFAPVTTDAGLFGQFSNNGGSTWFTTGYYYGLLYNSSISAAAFLDSENDTQILTPDNQKSLSIRVTRLYGRVWSSILELGDPCRIKVNIWATQYALKSARSMLLNITWDRAISLTRS
jgi:hypothetical protein